MISNENKQRTERATICAAWFYGIYGGYEYTTVSTTQPSETHKCDEK